MARHSSLIPLATQAYNDQRPTRKSKQQRGTCMAVRGCMMKARHSGPHRIAVSTARIEGYKAFGVKLVVCPKCGFYGSGPHTVLNADNTRTKCKSRGSRW